MEKEKLIALVVAVQNGEDDAKAAMYDAFYDDIYYYIKKTVNDTQLAEDLTQDTFIEILQTIEKLQEPAAFVTWSKTIAYHKCTAYFRKRKDLLADESEDGQTVFDTVIEEREEFIPDEALDKEDFKKTIQEMIDSLPAEQRSAIMMRYFDEISVKEIAEIQGVSEGTVKSRLNYGRTAIKNSVESYEKKHGIKLHCKGVIPLLLWLFREYRMANSAVAMATATTTATATTAATSSSATSTAAVKKGLKEIVKGLTKKLAIGATVTTVAVGGIVAYQASHWELLRFEKELQSFATWDGYDGEYFYEQAFLAITDAEVCSSLTDADPDGWEFVGYPDKSQVIGGITSINGSYTKMYAALLHVENEEAVPEIIQHIKMNMKWHKNADLITYPIFMNVSTEDFVFYSKEDFILISYVDPVLVENGECLSSEEMNAELDVFVELLNWRVEGR